MIIFFSDLIICFNCFFVKIKLQNKVLKLTPLVLLCINSWVLTFCLTQLHLYVILIGCEISLVYPMVFGFLFDLEFDQNF